MYDNLWFLLGGWIIPKKKKIKLGELLIKNNKINEWQLDEALKRQVIFGGRIGANLVELNIISEEELADALSEKEGVPYAHPKSLLDIDESVIELIPKEIAQHYRVLPVEINRKRLKLIMDDPQDYNAITEISFITECTIEPMVTPELRLVQALEFHYEITRTQRYIPFRDNIKERREYEKRRGPGTQQTDYEARSQFTQRELEMMAKRSGDESEEIISGKDSARRRQKEEQTPESYCPSCGEMVQTLAIVNSNTDVTQCANCGMPLEEPKGKIKTLKSVIAAEDSPLLLKKVAEMLELREIAHNVVPCKNGEEFITRAMSRMRAGLPVNLAILDVNMPIMNGINAAIVLRSIERAINRDNRVPILFFTSRLCDETFQKVLKYCTPAQYINKGTGSSPEEFADRLYKVIAGLLSQKD